MFHPVDEARRARADADRLDAFCRSWPADHNFGAGVLGLILAEKFLGWRPPWRRGPAQEVPARLVLSLSRRRPARRAFNIASLGAAND
jgi:hypothetical protein